MGICILVWFAFPTPSIHPVHAYFGDEPQAVKKAFWIYALIVAAAVLAIVLFRPRQNRTPTSSEAAMRETATKTTPPRSNPVVASHGARHAQASQPPPVSPKSPVEKEGDLATASKAFAESLNVPVNFYGLVIDQDSSALAGVVVKVNVSHLAVVTPNNPSPDLSRYRFKRATGEDGRFEINGVTGEGFDLESITKAGYEAEPTRRGFAATEGSYTEPVIFKMWNTNIHEKLISGHKSFDIVPDGRPYVVDLAKGTISESEPGDLKVWIKCPAQMAPDQVYDWSCGVDALNGGLLEEPPGVAMYLAPAEGYKPSFQLQGQIKKGQRGSSGERSFYVRLNNGQEYGAIGIGLYAPFNNQTPGLIRLSYTINPSGSRILR